MRVGFDLLLRCCCCTVLLAGAYRMQQLVRSVSSPLQAQQAWQVAVTLQSHPLHKDCGRVLAGALVELLEVSKPPRLTQQMIWGSYSCGVGGSTPLNSSGMPWGTCVHRVVWCSIQSTGAVQQGSWPWQSTNHPAPWHCDCR